MARTRGVCEEDTSSGQFDRRCPREPDRAGIGALARRAHNPEDSGIRVFWHRSGAVADVAQVNTLLVVGCTTSGCVRASVIDAASYNLRTIVIRDCVGDRALEPHEANFGRHGCEIWRRGFEVRSDEIPVEPCAELCGLNLFGECSPVFRRVRTAYASTRASVLTLKRSGLISPSKYTGSIGVRVGRTLPWRQCMLDRGYDRGPRQVPVRSFCVKRCNHRYLFGSGPPLRV